MLLLILLHLSVLMDPSSVALPELSLSFLVFFQIQIKGQRIEGAVFCSDCEAVFDKYFLI